MRDIDLQRIKHLGLKEEDFKPHEAPTIVRISREDFDLLQTTYKKTIYYITESDGNITVREGEF